MSAPVIAFEAAPNAPRERAEYYVRQVGEAYCALRTALEQRGLTGHDIDALMRDYENATYRDRRHWEHRAELAERSLRRVLEGDISDDVRAYVTAAIAGKSQRLIPTRPLNSAECRLIESYRRLDDADRQMIRRLFARLAAITRHAEQDAR